MNPDYPFQPQQQPSSVPQQPQPQMGYPASVPQQPQQPYQPLPQQPGYGPAPQNQAPRHKSSSPAKKWIILTCVFIFTTIAFAGAFTWALINYFDQKNNVDSKVSSAVSLAVKNQKQIDADAYAKAEKEPNRTFAGPDDYGRVSFQYPKTWSVYEESDASKGGTYAAYFNPGAIPPITKDQQYAIRLTIEDKDYDAVITGYANLVKQGKLKSSPVTVGEQNGTRLDGNFSDSIKGSAVVLKIRDKTVTVRTDAQTFTEDFNALIATVTFNK